MEIQILGFWSQGPRELGLRGQNKGFKECPSQSALLLQQWCSLSGRVGEWASGQREMRWALCLSHLQLQLRYVTRPAFVAS